MLGPEAIPLPDRLVRTWWVRMPLAARRLSAVWAVALADGMYLTAWPRAAAFLPPAAWFAGLLLGWRHWGFNTVFTESLAVLALAAALGVLSGQLGALFLVGFIAGDFLLFRPDWSHAAGFGTGLWTHLWRVRAPLLIEYGLLALLVINTPLITKALLAHLAPPARLSRPVRFGLAVAGHALLTYVLVYFWSQAVPILIRPVFTWLGQSPPTSAMYQLQVRGDLVVGAAVAASLVRMALQGLTAFRHSLGARLSEVQELIMSAAPVQPMTSAWPPWARVAGQSAWLTLMLAGMYHTWYDAVLAGAAITGVQAARAGLLPINLGPWPGLAERVPLLLRLVAGLLVIHFISRGILGWQMSRTNSFRPILVLTVLAIMILFLLNPGAPGVRQREGGRPG